ncbi:uncharacterized protein LOC117646349 [Thrips palmi]|uniref:Uncharacterized protein LOC117646349 n=1 Tax=Thrips palmi TaxID=161013 RepID=A0A6P8ZNX6_THRPL|nr:uncharacterized protein LOC117646349 [Thrips palmi]
MLDGFGVRLTASVAVPDADEERTQEFDLNLSGAAAATAGHVIVKASLRHDNSGQFHYLLVPKSLAQPGKVIMVKRKEPQPTVAATPPAQQECIEELDLKDLWEATPEERREEKAATLQRLRQRGVRRLTNVRCHRDPAWVLEVLRAAAPRLEEASVRDPRADHLRALHAMPRLGRLELLDHVDDSVYYT